MNNKLHTFKYLVFDFITAAISWGLFYTIRKIFIEPQKFGQEIPLEFNTQFYLGIIIIPLFWLSLYYLSGYYKDIYRKSRLKELGKTIFTVLIGVTILFFLVILDDVVNTYQHYYTLYFSLLAVQFTLTYIPRIVITYRTISKVHSGKIGFNTIIIGSDQKAVEIYKNIENQIESSGNRIIGFVNIFDKKTFELENHITRLGSFDDIRDLISKYNIEEVIIALEQIEHNEIERIINFLDDKRIVIKVIPSMYDMLTGKVKMSHIFGTPLIQISHDLMPTWQELFKQALDIIFALLALVITLPLSVFLFIGIRISSKGPIIYSHERIGKFGKPFTLYKFRSMYTDSEENGPALSSKDDTRITPFGKFMRKSKLDEIPNFFNVLKGDMSLVGPRPERQYYIDQIVDKAPHYLHLQKVKPGITSWGQVKYGYAENVEQMIERLQYDILYIENMSLFVDFKIMIHTILTILKGRNI